MATLIEKYGLTIDKHPYDKIYLWDGVRFQEQLFDQLQDKEGSIDTLKFIIRYMKSDFRAKCDVGHPNALCKNGPDIWYWLTKHMCGPHWIVEQGESIKGWSPGWVGRIYAYGQWKYNVKSAWLVDVVSPLSLFQCYSGMHDLTLDRAVDRIFGVPDLEYNKWNGLA